MVDVFHCIYQCGAVYHTAFANGGYVRVTSTNVVLRTVLGLLRKWSQAFCKVISKSLLLKKLTNKMNYKTSEEKTKIIIYSLNFDIATISILIHFLFMCIFQYFFKFAVKCVYTHKCIYAFMIPNVTLFLKISIISCIFIYSYIFITFSFNGCIRFHV